MGLTNSLITGAPTVLTRCKKTWSTKTTSMSEGISTVILCCCRVVIKSGDHMGNGENEVGLVLKKAISTQILAPSHFPFTSIPPPPSKPFSHVHHQKQCPQCPRNLHPPDPSPPPSPAKPSRNRHPPLVLSPHYPPRRNQHRNPKTPTSAMLPHRPTALLPPQKYS